MLKTTLPSPTILEFLYWVYQISQGSHQSHWEFRAISKILLCEYRKGADQNLLWWHSVYRKWRQLCNILSR